MAGGRTTSPGAGASSGAVRFGRYAYPPNELGLCGPDAERDLLEHVAAGADDGDLRRLARGFDGAWPYLELIAHANGLADPLDARVVEAYWLGNDLLRTVGGHAMADALEGRFRDRVGRSWDRLLDAVPAGAVPHHSFHVFGVYPWLGMLRGGRVDEPLLVLDRCRVRWGQVVAVAGTTAVVRSRPLTWDGRVLSLGEPRQETAVVGVAGLALAGPLVAGDWCALHWDWVCETLDLRRLRALRTWTARQLAVVNATPFPAPSAVLA